MKEIFERIFVGNESHCTGGDEKWAVVHACKSPCHQSAVGYRGNLPSSHPYYLVFEKDDHLFLNIIDPPVPLFMPSLFTSFLGFAKRKWDEGKKILIHCNQGESRAPSLALLFLAKYHNVISNDSYEAAREEFSKIFPTYKPGKGIQKYLSVNWNVLNEF